MTKIMEDQAAYRTPPSIKLSIYLLSLLLLGIGLLSISAVRMPLILAVIFYFILSPFIDRLERSGIPRGGGIGILYIILGLLFTGIFWLLSPMIVLSYGKLVKDLPGTIIQVRDFGHSLLTRFGDRIPQSMRDDSLLQAFSYLQDSAMAILKTAPAMVPGFVTTLLLIPVFGFFFLKDAVMIKSALLNPIPNRYFEIALNLSHMINKKVGAYIRGRLLESLIIGIIVGGGLFAIGFPYALFHGVLAAVLNLVPFIGPVVAAIPATILSFIYYGDLGDTATVVLIFTVAQVIDGAIIVPAVLSKIIDLHPIWVLAAIFAGGQLYGVIGMIIGVPIVAILKIAVEESIRWGARLK